MAERAKEKRAPLREGLSGRGLRLSRGGRTLVDALDFDLRPKSRLGLVGPSGSGKTTLLRAINTLDDLDAGELALHGRSPAEWGHPAWRRRVVLVGRDPALWAETVGEELERPFRYQVDDARFEEERARALLGRLSLRRMELDRTIEGLSSGERQRVALARALLLRPLALLLDEPTSALDPKSSAAVEEELERFIDGGGAYLLVAHDPSLVARATDERIELDDSTRGAS